MVSYEISIGLILMNVLVVVGSLDIRSIVDFQEHIWLIVPFFPLCLLLFISALAETTRAPFDLTEAEGELVAGFNVEYSATPFALFFMAEYINILAMATLITIVFLGGHHPIPLNLSFILPFIKLPQYHLNYYFDTRVHSFPLYVYVIYSRFALNLFDAVFFWKLTRFCNLLLYYNTHLISQIWWLYINSLALFQVISIFLVGVMNGIFDFIQNLTFLYTVSSTTIFVFKINCVSFLFLLVRASVPRYRYDLLLRLTWKVFFPISLGYLILTCSLLYFFDGLPPPG